jgi:hypothetical protein
VGDVAGMKEQIDDCRKKSAGNRQFGKWKKVFFVGSLNDRSRV